MLMEKVSISNLHRTIGFQTTFLHTIQGQRNNYALPSCSF